MSRKSAKKISEKKHTPVPPTAPPTATAKCRKRRRLRRRAPSSWRRRPPRCRSRLRVRGTEAPEVVSAAAAEPVEHPLTQPVTQLEVEGAIEAVQLPAVEPVADDESRSADGAIERLVAALHDPDADVAREAAASLGASGDRSAVRPLIDALRNADGYFHCVVRAAAAYSLGQLGDPSAVEPLLSSVNDTMAEASAEAVRALATLGDRRAIPALVEIVRNRDGFYLHSVRHAAVLALSRLSGGEAEAELTAVAQDAYENLAVREAAGQALRDIGRTEDSAAPASG